MFGARHLNFHVNTPVVVGGGRGEIALLEVGIFLRNVPLCVGGGGGCHKSQEAPPQPPTEEKFSFLERKNASWHHTAP